MALSKPLFNVRLIKILFAKAKFLKISLILLSYSSPYHVFIPFSFSNGNCFSHTAEYIYVTHMNILTKISKSMEILPQNSRLTRNHTMSLYVVSDSLQPHGMQHARLPCSSLSISLSLLKLMSTEPVMPSNHLILCHFFLFLTSIFPSIRVFSNELADPIRWPKYWAFSISPSNKYAGLISFRIDWFYLLAVQGTLKSLLQHHSLKATILPCSAFFMVQCSHPYMTTG